MQNGKINEIPNSRLALLDNNHSLRKIKHGSCRTNARGQPTRIKSTSMLHMRFHLHLLLGIVLAVPTLPVVDCCCTRASAERQSVPACCAKEPAPEVEPSCPHCKSQTDVAGGTSKAFTAAIAHHCQCRHTELPAQLTREQFAIPRQPPLSPVDSLSVNSTLFVTGSQHTLRHLYTSGSPPSARSAQVLFCRWLI